MNTPIKVGFIRCDTHALWFGPLMAEHDARVLHRPMDPGLPHSHSWQRGGCHRFFYTNYGDPLLLTAPFVGGFEVAKLWDEEPHVAEQAKQVFFGKPQICNSYEEVSDGVDLVFIAACNFDGSEHLKLATPGLKKGVPTFVDKPFADSVADARAMLDLSRKHKAPIFSLAISRVDSSVAHFKNRLPEVGEIGFATLNGYKAHPSGLVQIITVIQHLFGPGIETVRVLKAPRQTSIYLEYGDRPGVPKHGIMISTQVGFPPGGMLSVSVLGSQGIIHTCVPGPREWVDGTAEIIRMIKRMVETRETPAIMDEVVESVAVLEAFKKAESTGEVVCVKDFL